jgi:uncharacterized damage-inducible protein DinB
MENTIAKQIAKHLRDVHFGGNWTWSNFKDQLSDLDYQLAIQKKEGLNSIATLSFHATYYVKVQLNVLQGGTLDAKDELSFMHPSFNSQDDWNKFLDEIWTNAENAAKAIEELPDSILNEIFVAEKYGTYYRNLTGMIEHLHYHLGQIAIIKKIILQ